MAFDFLPLVVSAATSFGTSYLANGDYGPISTFSDLWYKKFGHLTEEVKDIQFQREQERVAKYVQETANLTAGAIAEIPTDNLHEPRENIARPSISAIEDYGSEKHTRKMFAKLIAASMDSRKDKMAQQSFVEIIKNMSPIDAVLLKDSFKKEIQIPIADIRLIVRQDKSFRSEFENLLLIKDAKVDYSDYELYASSLVNLDRLGLIDIDYSSWLSNEETYDSFKDTIVYKKSLSNLETAKASGDPKIAAFDKIEIGKGRAKITPLGKNFCAICLFDEKTSYSISPQ